MGYLHDHNIGWTKNNNYTKSIKIVLSTNPPPALPLKWKSVLYATYMAYYTRYTHPSIYEGREMDFAIAKEKGWVITALV